MKKCHRGGNAVPQCDDNISDAEITKVLSQIIHSKRAGPTAGPQA